MHCIMSSKARRCMCLQVTITGCMRSIVPRAATARRITGQLATAYTQGGAQLAGYSHQAASLASKRFKASLTVPGSVFMLTRAPEGNGNVLLQIDKDSGQPRSRVDLGKEREPV